MENHETNNIRTAAPAESFAVDFLNARPEIRQAMSQMGFVFTRSSEEGDGRVCFEGEMSDGTKMKMVLEMGEGYKTPAQLEEMKQKEE